MFPHETMAYLVNLMIGVIVAALLTHHWRLSGRDRELGYWMAAGWVMTVAYVVFAVWPSLHLPLGRVFPTLMVTAGHGILLVGARRTAGLTQGWRLVAATTFLHGLALVALLRADPGSHWHAVVDGAVWSMISAVSFTALRAMDPRKASHFRIPAMIFALHSVFHAGRLAFAAVSALRGEPAPGPTLRLIDDLEDSFFMEALFVSLLISHLQLRNEELRRALGEVRQLTSLLPICAWCRKVRGDEGYWQKLEHYFSEKGAVRFTHGICGDCAETHFGPTVTRVK